MVTLLSDVSVPVVMAPFLASILVLCVVAIGLFVAVVPFWLITSKAGFPGWFSLAMLIPLLNILYPFFLAFAEWPALRDRDEFTREGG